MTVSFGYTIVYVPDVGATIDFYTKAFGLAPRFVTPDNDYGELDTGSTTLAFASEALATTNLGGAGGYQPLRPDGAPVGVTVTLITDDVPAALAMAEGAGADVYLAPVDKPWGQTVSYLRDPNGFLIELATPVAPS